jgi:anthranilate synthase component 1
MNQYPIKVSCKRIPPHLGDVVTPVSIYLTLRDLYPNTILLESSDYHGNSNSLSFICFDPLADFVVENELVKCRFPDGTEEVTALPATVPLTDLMQSFINRLEVEKTTCPVSASGLFGYTSYDAVRYFESVKLDVDANEPHAIPDMRYHLYRSVIAFNHFTNQLFFIEHLYANDSSHMAKLLDVLRNRTVPAFSFHTEGDEKSSMTDDAYLQMVIKGKEHCFRGDVFQVVLSRQFTQSFKGDEFNVYRALRHINPSPYLFFFDYGNYRLFGSSPESQLIIGNGVASINPIAGTFKRTGDDMKDLKLAEDLAKDEKENAEHVMLVDLARNDLARNCTNVKVKTFKEIQYYSHVLHLVSEVNGLLKAHSTAPRVMGDTFPAGTLSGAPKFKAMELINKYEPHQRGFYGGCIGMMGLDGSFNQAISIRSFLSKDNTLFYQAGAGVVAQSTAENELNEVKNKLGALKKAIDMAKEF